MSSLTVAQLLAQGVEQLSVSVDGAESPKLDAQVLLANVLDKSRTWLMTWPDKLVDEKACEQYQADIARRSLGEPVAYITGVQEFWSLPIAVAPCTLIPRPDTEVLVEAVVERFSELSDEQSLNVLDLGTGTGAIALALASEKPKWKVEGVDFNADAVALANKNRQALNVLNTHFFQSDWFSAVKSDKKFAVIVSNPPYIEYDDEHLNQGGVRFEPKSALVADDDGLADIKLIAAQSKDYLAKNGALLVEHGWRQAQAVKAIFEANGFHRVETIKDYGGNDRITLGYLA